MLMAAGLGTRLRPFTDLISKPLLPVMGVPMAQFAVDLALDAGVTDLVANLHHQAARTRLGLEGLDFTLQGRRSAAGRIHFSDESGELLGSAGGIRKALPLLGPGPFLLLNTDVLCDVPVRSLMKRHQELRQRWGVDMTLAVLSEGPAGGKYREIQLNRQTGLVTGAGEVVAQKPFFSGVAIMEASALKDVPVTGAAEFLPTILLPAIRESRVGSFVFQGDWFDIGSPELWRKTHLDLIRKLETGLLRESWRKRIETVSRRASCELWVSADRSENSHLSRLASPSFLGSGKDASLNLPSDSEIPPGSVIYGDLSQFSPQGKGAQSLVSYNGTQIWI